MRRVSVLLVLAGCGSSGPTSGHADASQTEAGRLALPDAKPETGLDATPLAHDASDAKPSRDASSVDATDAASARANGSLGAWQALTSMPLPRANHCAVAAQGYLVVLGGNYAVDGSFVDTDEVDVALIHTDGSLGAWAKAGTTPSPVNGCTAVASGDTVYILDGIYDDMSDQGQSFSAVLSSAGVLGAWTTLGPLPAGQDVFYSTAWIGDDPSATLYVVDSSLTATSILTAPTRPSFGSWSTESWLAGFLGRPEYAFTGSYVYALGGYLSDDAGNPTVTTATGSAASASSIGAAFMTSALPMPVTYGCAVAVDDWLFVAGGKASIFGSGVASTYSAEVGSGGELAGWASQSALPEGRTDMAMTLAGDFLYVTGGGYMGPGLDTVYAARVRF